MITQQHTTPITLTHTINLLTDTVIDGSGMIITAVRNEPVITGNGVHSVVLKNITIHYDIDEPLTHDAIKLDKCANITFENPTIVAPEKGILPKAINNTTACAVRCDNCTDITINNLYTQFGTDFTHVHPGTGETKKAYGNGVKFYQTDNSSISNSEINFCATGVYCKHSDELTINNNIICEIYRWNPDEFGKGGCGILMSYGCSSTISDNRIYGCEEHGVYLSGGSDNHIIGNYIHENRGNGIQLNKGSYDDWLEVSYNIINNNTVNNNGMNGISLLRYAYNNVCNGNICSGNIRKAIQQSMGDSYFPREEWSKGNRIGYNISK
ncbi:MAG TPA: hypothetical protein ENH82_02715 [bacterium]|nr:hypothetical protein [bacterium]